MKINRFNENSNNFKLYNKTYKCDDTGVDMLREDIKDLIDSGNLLYDLYHKESVDASWNFILYSYLKDTTNTFYDFDNNHNFKRVTDRKDLSEVKHWFRSTDFEKITKEDIESIYISTISKKFNI